METGSRFTHILDLDIFGTRVGRGTLVPFDSTRQAVGVIITLNFYSGYPPHYPPYPGCKLPGYPTAALIKS